MNLMNKIKSLWTWFFAPFDGERVKAASDIPPTAGSHARRKLPFFSMGVSSAFAFFFLLAVIGAGLQQQAKAEDLVQRPQVWGYDCMGSGCFALVGRPYSDDPFVLKYSCEDRKIWALYLPRPFFGLIDSDIATIKFDGQLYGKKKGNLSANFFFFAEDDDEFTNLMKERNEMVITLSSHYDFPFSLKGSSEFIGLAQQNCK